MKSLVRKSEGMATLTSEIDVLSRRSYMAANVSGGTSRGILCLNGNKKGQGNGSSIKDALA